MAQNERRLVSVQVGKPKTRPLLEEGQKEGKTWRSGIYKEPVNGRVFLDWLNVKGDQQANKRFHGGPDKAVCCFASEHYPLWREITGQGEAFAYGAFGENFTLAGMTEREVCLGDIYAVGETRLQVSQPRTPCNNLVRKWGVSDMPQRMMDADQTGFYLRVLQPGMVGAGDTIALEQRLYPDITIAVANAALYRHEGGAEMATRLAEMPELFEGWRQAFQKRSTHKK